MKGPFLTREVKLGAYLEHDPYRAFVAGANRYLPGGIFSLWAIFSGTDAEILIYQNRNSLRELLRYEPNATRYEVLHELSHYLDYKRLGPEGFTKLTRGEREISVYERLKVNRNWLRFSDEERKHATTYASGFR